MATSQQVLAEPGPLTGGKLWLAAILLAAANFIAVLDMTIANVSVPSIAGSLGISSSQGTWVITSYAIAEAIVVPLTGWLAARFGAVRLFAVCMCLFGFFSVVCGMATSLGMLVFGRIMQGLAGGPLMPLSQTLLLRIFPKEKAPAATALWAMTTLTAPILGPILGGTLCDNFAWPIIFFINVPIALICAPIAWRMLKRYEESLVRAPIDVIGLVLLIVFVGTLQLMLDLGKEHDWFESTEICLLAVVAAIGFIAFLIWEFTEPHPIVNLRVFRHRGFATAVLTISLGFGAMFAANVLTPLWLQSYMNYTSTWAGLACAWGGVLAVFAAPIAGVLMTKLDPRKLICAGLLWLGFIMWVRVDATTDMTFWQISLPLLFMGIGLPFFFVPLTALALGSVKPEEMASAAGLMNFLRTLSGAVATSIVTTSWESKTSIMHAEMAGSVDADGETLRSLTSSGFTSEGARAVIDNMAQGQSVMLATNEIMLIVSLVFCLSALIIWLAPKPAHAVDMSKVGH